MRRFPVRTLLAGIGGLVLCLLFAHGRSTPYNNYTLFAQALLHGHLWIEWPGNYIDAVAFEGHRYIVNDPVPGFFMLPFVAIWGTAANQTLIACAFGGVATAAAWRFAGSIGCSDLTADWLAAFMLAGTDLLWCAMLGDVWYFAHVACAAFLLLALAELAGRGRPWLVVVFFALACGSRFSVVLTAPVFAYWCGCGFLEPRRDLRRLGVALLTIAPFALLYTAYNEARWHVPWDIGHTIFYHQDQYVGSASGSPFGIAYLGNQLYSFFVQGVTFSPSAPYVIPPQSGQALTLTSPALALAFFALRPRRTVISLWLAVVLAAAPSFLYYVNGFIQFGMRHGLDFEPFLFALMALAARAGLRWFWNVLIVWSLAVEFWGCWYWNTVYRTQY
ncbi:MAG: hypothetical protein WCE44_14305 [Candidatus Velthaea sp.]